MSTQPESALNEYTYDVYTSATVVVRAASEDVSRRLLAACRGVEPNLVVDSNIQVTEMNVCKVIALVHAEDPDGHSLEVGVRVTDGEIPDLE